MTEIEAVKDAVIEVLRTKHGIVVEPEGLSVEVSSPWPKAYKVEAEGDVDISVEISNSSGTYGLAICIMRMGDSYPHDWHHLWRLKSK